MKKKLSNISLSTIIVVFAVSILSGLFGATAATYLYNSNEVGYNNTESGIEATDVQGAIDELYAAATTYETLASRISYLETHITSDATSRIREYGIELNDTSGGITTGGYIDFHWQGSNADYTSRIIENANGVINLSAVNGVKANGSNIVTDSTKGTKFQATIASGKGTLAQNNCYRLGAINTCSFHISGLSASNFPAGSEQIIATVPAGYKPTYTTYFGYGFVGEGVSGSHYGYIDTLGNIKFQHSNGTITAILVNFSWINS